MYSRDCQQVRANEIGQDMRNLDEKLREQECEGSKHYTNFMRENGMAKCKFCRSMFYVTRTNSPNLFQLPTHYRRSL